MNIIENIIPKGTGVRTGKYLTSLKGLVVHWIGVAQPKASVIRNNFNSAQCGTHYIIDWNDGSIIHCVPDNEVCYHVGAKVYTPFKQQICGSTEPNWCLVGIECCINPNDKIYDDYSNKAKYPNLGKPSDVQYKNLVEFCAFWLKKNNMTAQNLYRHYDITGKACPLWFKNHEDKWEQLKKDVTAAINGTISTKPEAQNTVKKGEAITEENLIAFVNAGVIQSPEYWRRQNILHLNQLFGNAVRNGIDKRINNGITDINIAIDTLCDANIITSPEYWNPLIKGNSVQYLKELIINIANRSKNILQRIVHAESCGEDEKGQILVTNVIMNRCKDKNFPNGIRDVVFQTDQFTPIKNGAYKKAIPSEQVKKSVDKALCVDYSQGALYFRTIKGATPDCWHEKTLIKLFDHGGHRFYK